MYLFCLNENHCTKKIVIIKRNITIRIAGKVSRYIDASTNRATPSIEHRHLCKTRASVLLSATYGTFESVDEATAVHEQRLWTLNNRDEQAAQRLAG